jgi:hypothetical protein
VIVSVFDGLRDEAKRIVSMSEYCDFKKRIVAMSGSVLHSDMRAVLANDLALGVGKELGITKAEIKKAISSRILGLAPLVVYLNYFYETITMGAFTYPKIVFQY